MRMNNRHKYEYNVDLDGTTAAATVVRMVGAHKQVLEVGAGPGSITRLLKDHGNCRVTAVELDEKAIHKLSDYCERVYQCDLNDPAWGPTVAKDGKFQVVVAADVLEHLYDPWKTLVAMKALLDEEGYIVVSLPHIGHNAVVASIFREDFEYQEWGLLDKTHIRFFGIHNIQRLFNDAGYEIVEAEFITRAPGSTELAKHWNQIPDDLRQSLERNPFGNVYQVVVKAQPSSAPKKGLRLSSLPVPGGASVSQNTAFAFKAIRSVKALLGLKNSN
jgi:2-polyprenyl-3-methyl-5-hydroxy-6-metoxy-1,4-benzoquinol methylase